MQKNKSKKKVTKKTIVKKKIKTYTVQTMYRTKTVTVLSQAAQERMAQLNKSFDAYLKELEVAKNTPKWRRVCPRCKGDAYNDPHSGFKETYFCTNCTHCWRR